MPETYLLPFSPTQSPMPRPCLPLVCRGMPKDNAIQAQNTHSPLSWALARGHCFQMEGTPSEAQHPARAKWVGCLHSLPTRAPSLHGREWVILMANGDLPKGSRACLLVGTGAVWVVLERSVLELQRLAKPPVFITPGQWKVRHPQLPAYDR